MGRLARDPDRLVNRILDWQAGSPASGIAGISFIESRAGSDGVVDAAKVRAFVGYLRMLDHGARGRLARLLVADLLTGLDKRVARARLAPQEQWRCRLKWVFLTAFDACNLHCRGCYVRYRDPRLPSIDRLDEIVRQVRRLGVFQVHIVGRGEAFLNDQYRETLFGLARRHGDVRFTVLTNGTCLTASDARRLAEAGNVIPFVSIDGLGEINDARRGRGVYTRLLDTFRVLREQHVLFCFSTTVHHGNFMHVTSPEFVERMVGEGARLGIYCQYERCGSDADVEMRLHAEDEAVYAERLAAQNRQAPIPLRDQTLLEKARGCQARLGRSVYIDGLSGAVSPCFKTPFAPSDCNLFADLQRDSLERILGGGFFRRYRGEHTPGRQCFSHMGLERAWFRRAPEIEEEMPLDLREQQREASIGAPA